MQKLYEALFFFVKEVYMINNDPTSKRLKAIRIGIAVGIGFSLGCMLIIYIINRSGHNRSTLPAIYYTVLFALPFIYAYFFIVVALIERPVKKVAQQRVIAIQGGIPGRVAAEQPILSHSLQTFPITLALRANWIYFVYLFTMLFFFLSVLFLVATNFFTANYTSTLLYTDGAILLSLAVILGVACLLLVRNMKQHIEITEEGIHGFLLGQMTHLHWDEIQFFTLWGNNVKYIRSYEVSGPKGVIQWSYPVLKTWYSFVVPTISFEEYDKQMQTVLAIIAMKTHLPLYDLRLKW